VKKEREMNEPEFELSKELRGRLKAAVKSVPVPPYLEARVRANIRETRTGRAGMPRLMAVAAGIVVCLATLIAYELGHLPFTSNSQDQYIASVSERIASIMRVGLRDHIHCAVYRKFPKDPPKAEDLAAKLGEEYKDLAPVVTKAAGNEYRLMLAHECRYLGRKYVHLALKNRSSLMSVVITQKREGESLETGGVPRSAEHHGLPLFESGVQEFQIAAFETRDHLVYLVSDASRPANTRMLVAMTPGIRALLQRLEA
jgi:hypothetical protein